MKKYFFFLLLTPLFSLAQTNSSSEKRVSFIDVFTKIPDTSVSALESSFSKEAIPGWGIVLGTTALTYYYDENLYRYSQKLGRDWGIGNEDNTKPAVQAFGHPLAPIPLCLRGLRPHPGELGGEGVG